MKNKEAMRDCWECRDECQDMLFNHCLQQGGDHVAQPHVKIMTDCIEICQITADFLRRKSPLSESLCSVCAEVCEECAKSCAQLGDKKMDKCAETCRQCADSCRQVGGLRKAA